ncbi:hypothetical protein RRG08_061297 [Elysia crispata]|uniref:PiggyBac transposable element-derived protein domain-containing protein n=1 Tax=Elysia crispata TaxID=231223 RepID=A0AAE1CY70_9GAST|nr:hypothetical protein RRG08_061297 [Elysia crispata]
MQHIVRETNKYASDVLDSPEIRAWVQNHRHSRYRKWPENGISIDHLKKFLGLPINMGLNPKNRLNDFWTIRKSQFQPYFGSLMPMNIFELMGRMLHINDKQSEVERGQPGFDPWVLDAVNNNSKEYYIPSENIYVDESMIGMKNRVANIQFMPNKRHARFGIKKFELGNSNGFILHITLYAGKNFDVRHEENLTFAVVQLLLQEARLLQKGYHVFTDNFYTKPKLAMYLHSEKTKLTGIIRVKSKDFPADLAKMKLVVAQSMFSRKDPCWPPHFGKSKVRGDQCLC